ncbi:DUF6891 domain-containing protein [Streptomyces uncialis]|uniref:DUF6891 domain-containing protein n=1 Tax=Streptomyces uncialis TaxID=1048205 RepID=UPI002257011E|nr:hypothetical protein [Streptomyces uncialis]MCX4663416.1 hypothetical protein [Streptomyces uncialis]WTE10489.1 hypothetical protein OG924_09405 [Streptomyces uncialis]
MGNGSWTGARQRPDGTFEDGGAAGLPVKVESEDGSVTLAPSPGQLRELVGRIGGQDDHFLVVQRVPDLPDVFVQVWHVTGREYRLEHRESRSRFFGTVIAPQGVEQVAEAVLGWARGDEDWGRDLRWKPVDVDPPEEVPALPDELREPVEERIRELLRCGYLDREGLAEAAEEWLVGSEEAERAGPAQDDRPVSPEQARVLVDGLWLERVAESARWTGTTDPERLTRAFAALEGAGITAREDFTCCRGCGLAEIGAEAVDGARGFVFFHEQQTEAAAAGGGLFLLYGGFDGSAATAAAVGHEVVAALSAAGLSTQWDGSAGTALVVSPLDWRKRLVG